MKTDLLQKYRIGVMGIGGTDAVACGAFQQFKNLCNADVSLNCAHVFYQQFQNTWTYWK